MHLAYAPSMEVRMVVMLYSEAETMEETGKKSAEESESLYVGSSIDSRVRALCLAARRI